tara:strand:- start:1583 stop:1807 length:225 start_codon:yes stop_codon:yes gene_type:complete
MSEKLKDFELKNKNPEANLLFMKVWLDKYSNNNKVRSDDPSEFMKQYVEATYNLFQIQQKRIDDLEKMLKEYIV